MRIAIVPVNTDNYGDEITGATSIAYLLSYLEKYFPEDLMFSVPGLDYLLRTKPDIVGISAPYSQTYNKVIEMARIIKEKYKIPVIVGGQHISYIPKTLHQIIDIGVIGEGEETFRDLITLYKDEGQFNEKSLQQIPGIVYHSKIQRVITEKRKPFKDIDSVPLTRKFFVGMPGNWSISLITGRGIPYKTFYSVGSDEPVRLHSAERIMGDCIDIISFFPEVKYVPVLDELFLYDIERFKQFAEIVKETNLPKYFRFGISARPDQLTDEVLELLKEPLDIHTLNINFVSPSVKTQKDLREPIADTLRQMDILKKCYKYGFNVHANFMLGAPNESKEEIAKNYWIIRNNHAKLFNNVKTVNELLIPYPGTEAWQKGIMRRLVNESLKDWDILDGKQLKKDTPVLNILHSKGEFTSIAKNYQELTPKSEDYSGPLDNLIWKTLSKVVDIAQDLCNVDHDGLKKLDKANKESGILNRMKPADRKLFEGAEEHLKKYSQLLLLPDNFKKPKEFKTDEKEVHNLSFISTLDKILKKDDISSIVNGSKEIDDIFEEYNKLYREKRIKEILYSKEVFNLPLLDVLEHIVKNVEINTILQITEPVVVDLRKILSEDRYEIDTLSPRSFKSKKHKLPTDKKYDCVLLLFTLDILPDPVSILKYCSEILKEDGVLTITFFNVKSIFVINQLLNNTDIGRLFFSFNKLNHFSMKSMSTLLTQNGFLTKKITPLIFPSKKNIEATQQILVELLNFGFGNKNDEYTAFSYTYSCRKLVPKKV